MSEALENLLHEDRLFPGHAHGDFAAVRNQDLLQLQLF
jgi:hypothetical protein